MGKPKRYSTLWENPKDIRFRTDNMNSNDLNDDQLKRTPRVIFVKEYKSDPAYQTSNIKRISTEKKDDRILVSPLKLQDDINNRSFHRSISLPVNESNESNQNSIIVRKLVDVIDRRSFGIISVVSLCIMSFLSLTLIPYHNVVLFPFYWYESILILVCGAIPCCFGLFVVQVKMIMEYQDITRPTIIFKFFVLWVVIYTLVHCLVHLLWSFGLGYNDPIPFSLGIDFYLTVLASWTIIWYLVPQNIRSNSTFPDRFRAYVCYILWTSTVPVQISVIFETFKELCNFIDYDANWMIAVLLFVMKKKSDSMMTNLLSKVAVPEKIGIVKGLVTIENGCMFKSFTLVLIGSMTDATTGYCFLGISILQNIKICVDIIHMYKPNVRDTNLIENSRKRKQRVLTTLMLNESSDLLITIAYMLSISIAYYGPNAGIIGNVQNNYWQYHAIHSFSKYLTGISYSVLIDISCGIVTLIALKYFCSINGLLFFKDKIGQFAYAFIFCISREMNMVSILL